MGESARICRRCRALPSARRDRNVLVYEVTGSDAERDKPAQVLQEFYVTVTRNACVAMSPMFAQEGLDQLNNYRCAAIDTALVKLGIAFSARYRLSYWDGAMMAAAETLGARVIYTVGCGVGEIVEHVAHALDNGLVPAHACPSGALIRDESAKPY
jgi:predicted nucleic acid-binding protein